MKSLWITALVVLSAACMQKHADGTYHITTTMDQTTKQDAKKTGDDLKADAKKLGKTIEQKSAEAADKAGDALHHAGEKLRNDSSKRH